VAQSILVVDDEPGIRQTLYRVLTSEQYGVIPVANAMEALERLAAQPVNLAIVDLLLPDVSGLELAEAIRMLDPGTPVVLITAYGAPAFESIASHPAISSYLHKPFDIDRLLEVVQRFVSR
jgi:DNA-binding NtrC family response regulator